MVRKALLLLLLVFSLDAEEEAPHFYLTWAKDPTTTMEIFWLSGEASEGEWLEWREAPETAFRRVEGKGAPLPSLSKRLQRVSLEGLEPNRRYEFRFQRGLESHFFWTLPKEIEEPLLFVEGGDCYHGAKEPFFQMMKRVGEIAPRFLILGGDLAYDYSRGSDLDGKAKRWEIFFEGLCRHAKSQKGDQIPLLVTIGNHEVKGSFGRTNEAASLFYALFPTMQRGYERLDIGDYLSLYLLDSGHTHKIGGAQAAWLKEALQERREALYRFAIYHVPAFPSVRAYHNRYSKEVRMEWVPLFEEGRVTAVFEHHDHALKRSYPIKGGKVSFSEGTLYLGDGSFGIDLPRRPKMDGSVWYLAKSLQAQAVWCVTLSKKRALFEALSVDGALLDSTERPPSL